MTDQSHGFFIINRQHFAFWTFFSFQKCPFPKFFETFSAKKLLTIKKNIFFKNESVSKQSHFFRYFLILHRSVLFWAKKAVGKKKTCLLSERKIFISLLCKKRINNNKTIISNKYNKVYM